MEGLGNKRPKSVTEYFTWLYCKRKKLQWGVKGNKIQRQALRAWNTLNSAEQDVFINKYNKWQAENDNRVATMLQYAEPFMKKKHNRINQNLELPLTVTQDGSEINQVEQISEINQVEQIIVSSQMPASSDDNSSDTVLEVANQENLNDDSHVTETKDTEMIKSQQMTQPNDDNLSNATSEITNRFYAASVIDTDIDETPGQPEINANAQHEILTEPIRPSVKNGRELFETLKCSGTRPELATIQWKDMSPQDKAKYFSAILVMKKQYLIKYEEYLESLSNPELFKHYIKTLNK